MDIISTFAVSIVITIILCLPMFAMYVVSYVLEGIAFNKLSKERAVKNLWLVWVPHYVEYVGKKYIMAQITDESDFRLLGGKLVFKNRLTAFWIYLAVYVGITVLSFITSLLSIIPIVGLIVLIIYFIIWLPAMVVLSIIEFGYLRDMLNVFKPDRSANVTHAILLTIGNIFTFGLARAIYLFILTKKLTPVSFVDKTVE